MSHKHPSMAGRAVVAILLLVGFYVLGVVVALVLIALPVLEIMLIGGLHLVLLGAPLLGVGVLVALVPRRVPFSEPGIRFDEATQPGLVDVIERAAGAAGEPIPARMYLVDEVNAYVSTVGGVLGLGGQRVLAVGVPLLETMTVQELESVMAHEFGHFVGGDTKLTGIIYSTRNTIVRAFDQVGNSVVQSVFILYWVFYVRVTQKLSRSQELAADRLAATATDPKTAASALARLPLAHAAYSAFLREEYGPVLDAGFRAPYLDGFRSFIHHEEVAVRADEVASAVLGVSGHSRYDSHPPIPERIRLLGEDPVDMLARPVPTATASTLLCDRHGVDAWLVQAQLRGAHAQHLDWSEVPKKVLVPAWRRTMSDTVASAAPDLGASTLPTDEDGLAELGTSLASKVGRAAARPDRIALARNVVPAVIGTAAIDGGWEAVASIGATVMFSKGGETFDLIAEWEAVLNGDEPAQHWVRVADAAGLDHNSRRSSSARRPAESPGAVSEWTGSAAITAPGGASYRAVPPGQGVMKNRPLVIEGEELLWGQSLIRAQDVVSIAYSLSNESQLRTTATIVTPDTTIKIRLGAASKSDREGVVQAWQSVVEWSGNLVEPRLADAALDRLRAGDPITVAGLGFTPGGIEKRGRVVPYAELAVTDFDGKGVEVMREADSLSGAKRVVRVSAKNPNAVVIPELVRAARLEFS